jgi:hypothetical protein
MNFSFIHHCWVQLLDMRISKECVVVVVDLFTIVLVNLDDLTVSSLVRR